MKTEKVNVYPKKLEEAKKHDYQFWNTQPVPGLTETVYLEGEIRKLELESEITHIPSEFELKTVDMTVQSNLHDISLFLSRHYIEDTKGLFRPIFSEQFLSWYYLTPTYDPDFTIGIYRNNIMCAFIGGTVIDMQFGKKIVKTVDVNFLCVHPKLRKKGLAVFLMKELARRSTMKNVSQGYFTTDVYLPKPFARVQTYCRAINLRILVETKFTKIIDGVRMQDAELSLKLPTDLPNTNFIPMKEEHVTQTYESLNKYFQKYKIHPVFSLEQFKHYFFNNEIVTTYVVEKNGKVVDMLSFYNLPSQVLNPTKEHKMLNVAYVYYYTSNEETPYKMLKNTLIVANQKHVDVVQATDMMENKDIMKDLLFEEGPNKLNLYTYNWKLRDCTTREIAKAIVS